MMKKFISALLSAIMIISSVAAVSAAESMDIDCQLSNTNLEVGDTFYADFKVTDNPYGYNSMTAYLSYDPSVMRAVPCEVSDIPSDLIIYTNDNGANLSLFSFNSVNSRLDFVPRSGDSDYNGLADGKKSASEIGIIKLTNYLGASIDNFLQNYTGTGTLLRMKFEAVGNGNSDIDFSVTSAAYFVEGKDFDIDVNVSNGSVNVSGGENLTTTPETQATTESTTESTTVSNNSSNNNSSSGSGSSGSGSSVAVRTTEATTEITTTEKSTETTTSSVNVSAVSFKDVASGMWYYEPIMKLAGAKVVNGYSDNTFKPNDNVKRADFLLMLLRGMGVDTTKAPNSNFADVASGKYYYNAVGIAKEMGIASGDGINFNPESNITRQDMMILAKKALEITAKTTITGNTSVLDKFNDKSQISAYAVDSLAAMVEAGIVNGMGEGIAPKANTTRAQAVVIISKIMEKL